ncbi:hypothetical protein XENTR_v10010103 [Xenopus tropicalis]|nr:hypothetical protein XENTR_v10010103 [Xenopus tropicalis]
MIYHFICPLLSFGIWIGSSCSASAPQAASDNTSVLGPSGLKAGGIPIGDMAIQHRCRVRRSRCVRETNRIVP